jgi:NADPH-dependent glutamate synthase beta subunit-like oxidoreductase
MARVVKRKRGLRDLSSGSARSGLSTQRPQFVEKLPPCGANCPNHNAIRAVLTTIATAKDHGKSHEEAFEEAFYMLLETTPFPSVCGRVCPHPCESECNRTERGGAVAISRVERSVGDFGLERGLKAKKLTDQPRPEKIAIVGSGPGGLSAAYHLARRGYPVTIFEALPKAGGMLRYGIPDYRLPQGILDAEIIRILDMGVELRLNTAVGTDVSLEDLRSEYGAVFVAIGAHQGVKLGVDGEDAANALTGTEFLHRVNTGERIETGNKVVVIGGGDTAVDAARVSRRLGADVTIVYRRTRAEMPAIEEEIDAADQEGVQILYLAAPIEIRRQNDRATGMRCQRMELGEPDSSGRRRPVPIEGDTFDLAFSSLITAVSQAPEFAGFQSLVEEDDWIKVDESFQTKVDGVYSGGDDTRLGLVVDAIAHGRAAASSIHEMFTGERPRSQNAHLKVIRSANMQLGYYSETQRLARVEMPVEERLEEMLAEVVNTDTKEDVIQEAKRCMSCGMCFECGTCWSFCQDNAIIKPLTKGAPYKFNLKFCTGCGKCAEVCPSGYIEML